MTGKVLNDSKEVNILTEVGGSLIHVKKLGQNEGFSSITPTVVIAVRGTKFEVDVKKNGTTKTTVLEGKVAVKLKLPQIENITDDLIQKSETLKNILGTLNAKEIVIETGSSSEVNSETIKSFLKETGTVDLIANLTPNNVGDIDKKFIQSPSQKADSKMVEEKLRECEELLFAEREKLKDPNMIQDAIKQRTKLNEKLVMKRIEQIIGKESEIYIMKDGRRIIGVTASQDAVKIKIQTSYGLIEILKNDVENVEPNE